MYLKVLTIDVLKWRTLGLELKEDKKVHRLGSKGDQEIGFERDGKAVNGKNNERTGKVCSCGLKIGMSRAYCILLYMAATWE